MDEDSYTGDNDDGELSQTSQEDNLVVERNPRGNDYQNTSSEITNTENDPVDDYKEGHGSSDLSS